LRAQRAKINVAIDRAQQMIGWNPIIETEILKHCGRLHPTAIIVLGDSALNTARG